MGFTRIRVIQKDSNPNFVFAESLRKNGYSRMPGTSTRIGPIRESDGRYRTGLDENAQYIRLLPADEQSIEKERVKKLRTELEETTGIDLSPNSKFYSDMYDVDSTGAQRVVTVSLSDKDVILNQDVPIDRITEAWLIVHPLVARSLADYKGGKSDAAAGWYVSDPEGETQDEYNNALETDKAKATLLALKAPQLRRMARLMELPVNEDSSQEHTYMLISKELDRGKMVFGTYKNRKTVNVFNDLAALSETTLANKDLVKQSLSLSIYRKDKTGNIMQGTEKIANNEDDLVATLSASTDERAALEKKISSKLKLSK